MLFAAICDQCVDLTSYSEGLLMDPYSEEPKYCDLLMAGTALLAGVACFFAIVFFIQVYL